MRCLSLAARRALAGMAGAAVGIAVLFIQLSLGAPFAVRIAWPEGWRMVLCMAAIAVGLAGVLAFALARWRPGLPSLLLTAIVAPATALLTGLTTFAAFSPEQLPPGLWVRNALLFALMAPFYVSPWALVTGFAVCYGLDRRALAHRPPSDKSRTDATTDPW